MEMPYGFGGDGHALIHLRVGVAAGQSPAAPATVGVGRGDLGARDPYSSEIAAAPRPAPQEGRADAETTSCSGSSLTGTVGPVGRETGDLHARVHYVHAHFRSEAVSWAPHLTLDTRSIGRAVLEALDRPARQASPPAPRTTLVRPEKLLVRSPAMREVLDLARKIAASDAPVLIQGERGAGKRSVATEVHHQSMRAGGPFVRVACEAIPREDLERQLFGAAVGGEGITAQEAGGLVQQAQGGTLYLDGVDRLPPRTLARLYEVLHASKLGSPEADFRLITSITSNPDRAANGHPLSLELQCFLGVAQINVPPLRHRRADIRPLAERFLGKMQRLGDGDAGSARRGFSEEAWRFLLDHPWPGNIPQLAGVVAGAALLADEDPIALEWVAKALGNCPQDGAGTITVPLAGGLENIERLVVEEMIRRHDGNKAAAARALGIPRKTLYRMLDQRAAGRSQSSLSLKGR